jgi:general secretion pathway protein J
MFDEAATGPREPTGFTILEIMIAVFILAIIVTTLFSSYNVVLSNAGAIRERMNLGEMSKNCIDRMVLDLRSIYIELPPAYAPPELDDPPAPFRIVGDKTDINTVDYSRLRFTSDAHLSFKHNPSPGGIAEIVYYAQEGEEGNVVLRRADNLYPYPEFEENETDPLLCEAVKSLAFTYYDDEGTDYDNWDSESPDFKYATPRAVGITLEIGDDSSSQTYETQVLFPVSRKKDNIPG